MSDVVEFVVENFAEEYDEDWDRLMSEVESIGRIDEAEDVATAKIHLVVKNEVVIGRGAFKWSTSLWKVTATRASEVGDCAFYNCVNLTEAILPKANSVGEWSFRNCPNLTNVRLPNAISIGGRAFLACNALRHITLHPNVNIDKHAFIVSLSLEVLATCAGFELDTGDKYYGAYGGFLDPTVAITRYLKSQCELDEQQRDVFLTYNFMLKLCNHHTDKKTGVVRATPQEHDHLANFLINNEDQASHILSFIGIKWGEKDLRNASKEHLLEFGLQKKVLRKELNEGGVEQRGNGTFWGVEVDENGDVVEAG